MAQAQMLPVLSQPLVLQLPQRLRPLIHFAPLLR
jgi:hypothetical protein